MPMTKKGAKKVCSSGILKQFKEKSADYIKCGWNFIIVFSSLVNTSDLDKRTFENDEVFAVSLRK